MDLITLLLKRGYKEYNSQKTGARFFQKKFMGKVVCDCNDANFIDIEIYDMRPVIGCTMIQISLKAEKQGRWWDIKCYGLSEKELGKNIASLEKKIIKAFETVAWGVK
jgi:hypothetical protein